MASRKDVDLASLVLLLYGAPFRLEALNPIRRHINKAVPQNRRWEKAEGWVVEVRIRIATPSSRLSTSITTHTHETDPVTRSSLLHATPAPNPTDTTCTSTVHIQGQGVFL